ncbi:MAG: DUF1326 domain-containing protein [Proteobacteria bacterium]|nr:MAG: DUF1326 domain-containing protein [Pseudomonadota bacterium]
MATSWSVSGEYMEACSCDFLCPCIPKNMTTPATLDFCKVALAFDIRAGSFGATQMAGVRFVMVAQSKAIMSQGDWIGGLIIDTAASDEQLAAVAAIAGAEGHGPLGMFAPLISDFRGVERADIQFTKDGGTCSVVIDGMIDQSIVGVESMSKPGEFVCIDNSGHPVNARLNFATALKNVITCFGIEWEDKEQRTNGHFASFDWHGEAA